jgi:hypothetical protein
MERKNKTISIRISKQLKDACEKMAANEHRSITNLIEVMIRERAEKSGVKIK